LFTSSQFHIRNSLNPRVLFNRWVHAAALIAFSSVVTVARGADWFFQPAVTVGTAYEENVDLDEDDPINATSYNAGASVRGGRLTERSQVVGTIMAFFERYPGNGELDEDNLSAAVNLAFLPTELDRLSLDLSLIQDTSRSSELTTTGNITENVPHFVLGIGAAWQRQLTERSAFTLALTHSGGRFDSNSSGLVDSQENAIDASYSYQLTEQLAFRGALGATYYDPDDDQSYKNYEALLGMRYAFSETLAGNLDIGWERIDEDTDLDTATNGSTASGFVYGLSLSKAFERSSLSLSLRRSAVPTGSGEPLVQESLGLGYAYQFSPRLNVRIPIGVYRNESINFGNGGGNDGRRIFFTTEPRLSWRVTEDIVLSASYRYQYERDEEADTTADGNAVFLSLSYVWPTEIPGLSQ